MSLQLIIGNSGAGKSTCIYKQIIRDSLANPGKKYFIIVPEQFTMQTQKNLVLLHPGHSLLNIDILSFARLAYRVFEETGTDQLKILEDIGKSMVIRKVVQENKKKLPYLGEQMQRPGTLDEVKSLICEFLLYDIDLDSLEQMLEDAKEHALLKLKLQDVKIIYEAFLNYLEGHYITAEEVLDVLLKVLPFSEKLKDAVLLFDGFTGFTPVQLKLIRELLKISSKVYVTVTMDVKEPVFAKGRPYQLFYMSHKMIGSLTKCTDSLDDPILIEPGEKSRFSKGGALAFLEQNIFRYKKRTYPEIPEEIRLFHAKTPLEEMQEVACRIWTLVREEGMRFQDIAVITGNLEEYGSFARRVFDAAGLPCFIDETHSLLMNPFVEYLRSLLAMVLQQFSYESVFRYLRSGMTDFTPSEIDRLENYCLALGIRGYKRWKESWVRCYRNMPSEELSSMNLLRQRFIDHLASFMEVFGDRKRTVRDYCTAFYEITQQSGQQSRLKSQELSFKEKKNGAMEKEYAGVYGIVMGLLDKMVEILGDETVTREEFSQLIETGLAKTSVALIPPGIDQIMVGDMQRTRLKDIKALFFVGVNEGNIPKEPSGGGILSDMDRDFFEEQGVELAPGPKEQMNIQRFYLYLSLTRPSSYLCLSYTGTNTKGEAHNPAFLIRNLRELFPLLKEEECHAGRSMLQTPKLAMDLFLYGLKDAARGSDSPEFEELYSWFLNSPIYRTQIEKLIDAAFFRKPDDNIAKAAAKVLYGNFSPQGATKLEKYASCAYAYFLADGLKITERAIYEFRQNDLGTLVHNSMERFAKHLHDHGLDWGKLDDETRNELIDGCLDQAAADYGNSILLSSARDHYMIDRARRLLRRSVWALGYQLSQGEFAVEGFELSAGGGRIDRLDYLETEDKVYLKVIDYKTGNTHFDLLSLYHGLQMQLLVYLNSAVLMESRKHPEKEIQPVGIFYYNVKDPMLKENIDADLSDLDDRLLKEQKMNGLALADEDLIKKMDRTLVSLPVTINKNGGFSKNSSLATPEQFRILNRFLEKKVQGIRGQIEAGKVEINPYMLKNRNACEYCAFKSACGFHPGIKGFEFRRLKEFKSDQLWHLFEEEVASSDEMDKGPAEGH